MTKLEKQMLATPPMWELKTSYGSVQTSHDAWLDPESTLEQLVAAADDLTLKDGIAFHLVKYEEVKVGRTTRARRVSIKSYQLSNKPLASQVAPLSVAIRDEVEAEFRKTNTCQG